MIPILQHDPPWAATWKQHRNRQQGSQAADQGKHSSDCLHLKHESTPGLTARKFTEPQERVLKIARVHGVYVGFLHYVNEAHLLVQLIVNDDDVGAQ